MTERSFEDRLNEAVIVKEGRKTLLLKLDEKIKELQARRRQAKADYEEAVNHITSIAIERYKTEKETR